MDNKDRLNINKLKNDISIVDVISTFVTLSKKGNNYVGLCPFHDDKHASLTVNESKKIYKCFSCNNGGDVFTFVKNFKGIGYFQAIIEACNIVGINPNEVKSLNSIVTFKNQNDVYYKINNDAAKYFSMFLNNKENENARHYLETRDINNEIIKTFGIGFAPNDKSLMIDLLNNKNDIVKGAKGFSLKDIEKAGISKLLENGEYVSYFQNRITFTIRDENDEIVGFSARTISNDEPKYINTPTTPIFTKNSLLYNLNNVLKNYDTETIYIMEGFMDVIAMHKLGYINAIATMGVAFTKEHINTLSRLENLKNVIICFDNDQAGQTNIMKTAELLSLKYNTYIVQYLSEQKDIDEIQKIDVELAKKTINNVISFEKFKILQLISKTNFDNGIDKQTSLTKIIDILNTYKNNIELVNDINYVAEIFNISPAIIKETLEISNKPKQKYKYNTKKYEINDVVLKEHKYTKWKNDEIVPTKLTEIEILKFSLLSRNNLELFFNKCGRIIDSDIKNIMYKIQDYYFNNPNVGKIDQNQLVNIFDNNKYLSQVTIILNELSKKNVKYVSDKVNQIIDTHIKNLKKIDKQKIMQKISEGDDYSEEYIKLLERMNKEN